MPSSLRSSSSTRSIATESIPPETAIPTRSPARSNSSRRMWLNTFCARGCTGTWYRNGELALARQPKARPELAEGAGYHLHDHLQSRTFLRNQLLNLRQKLRRSHVLGLFFPTRAHVHFSRLGFFIPDHQEKRNLLHGMFADLGIHFFVARIHFHAHADRL